MRWVVLILIGPAFFSMSLLKAIQEVTPEFPLVIKDNLTGDVRLTLRNSVQELKDNTLESKVSSDPISLAPFDALFDEAHSKSIIIAGVITKVNNNLVIHYFDGLWLMGYFSNMHKIPLSSLDSNTYKLIRYAYQHNERRDIEHFYLEDEVDDNWSPMFLNPINKQQIVSILFYKLNRTQENLLYTYKLEYLGDAEQVYMTYNIAQDFTIDLIISNSIGAEKYQRLQEVIGLLSEVDPYNRIASLKRLLKNFEEFKHVLKEEEFKSLKLDLFANLADAYISELQYKDALTYLESIMNDHPDALLKAAKIRVGFMSEADQKEQLKGIQLFKEYLSRGDVQKGHAVILDFVKILVDRGIVSADGNEYARSLLEPIANAKPTDSEDSLLQWAMANIEIGRTYSSEKKYEDAIKHFLKVDEELKNITGKRLQTIRLLAKIYKTWLLLKMSAASDERKKELFDTMPALLKSIGSIPDDLSYVRGYYLFMYTNIYNQLFLSSHSEQKSNRATQLISLGKEALKALDNYLSRFSNKPLIINDFIKQEIGQMKDIIQKNIAEAEKFLEEFKAQDRDKKRKREQESPEEPPLKK
jgi:tetratricopeptide (TPR) repeat protein